MKIQSKVYIARDGEDCTIEISPEELLKQISEQDYKLRYNIVMYRGGTYPQPKPKIEKIILNEIRLATQNNELDNLTLKLNELIDAVNKLNEER